MKYAEAPHAGGDGQCKDPQCPCGDPGVPISRGTGYLCVTKEFVAYRKDCLTLNELMAKQSKAGPFGHLAFASHGVDWPILMCEQGAKKRNINLECAAADAIHWWKTGLVPMRVTPSANKTWWQFWK